MAPAADRRHDAAHHQATLWETLELLEYLILLCPIAFLLCRVLQLRALVKPELWCLLQTSLVVLLMLREMRRGVGQREKKIERESNAHLPEKTVLQKIVHFCTSTKCGTDRHKPTKSVIKGASCFLFALPACEIMFNFEDPLYSQDYHEALMLFSQCIFSYMADHAMVPHDSIWHPADRISALALTGYGIAKPIILGYNMEDMMCSYTAVTAVCIYFSQIARRHHGLPSHHIHHALFHVVVAAGWNYTSLSVLH
eukprot:TRINITY_DN17804_c0_g4_i1.p1 TRINITY_DN17804_c0_g4~~TRINITY_DN17804_c0_g4_i1.p1  ORF type:complete len:290 (+),score=62.67 TRINITY_DN17804_c0_g4_i1:111-872(+)